MSFLIYLLLYLIHYYFPLYLHLQKMIFDDVSKRMNEEFVKSAILGFGSPTPKKEGDPFSIMDLAMK